MKEIKLHAAAISKLMEIDLDYVIFKMTGAFANRKQNQSDVEKEIKSIRKKYKFQLFDMSSIPVFSNNNAVSDDLQGKCILREYISQVNTHPEYLMRKVIEDKSCVEKISFCGKYSYFDMFLSEENVLLIKKKLSEVHLGKYGKDKYYVDYTKNTQNTAV